MRVPHLYRPGLGGEQVPYVEAVWDDVNPVVVIRTKARLNSPVHGKLSSRVWGTAGQCPTYIGLRKGLAGCLRWDVVPKLGGHVCQRPCGGRAHRDFEDTD